MVRRNCHVENETDVANLDRRIVLARVWVPHWQGMAKGKVLRSSDLLAVNVVVCD